MYSNSIWLSLSHLVGFVAEQMQYNLESALPDDCCKKMAQN